jgi:hypothetical protein
VIMLKAKYCHVQMHLNTGTEYLCNKGQQDALFSLVYFSNISSTFFEQINYLSSGSSFTVYAAYGVCHSTPIVLAAGQRRCMKNTICCIYSKATC